MSLDLEIKVQIQQMAETLWGLESQFEEFETILDFAELLRQKAEMGAEHIEIEGLNQNQILRKIAESRLQKHGSQGC